MLAGHGVHDFPVAKLSLEHVAVGQDDVELEADMLVHGLGGGGVGARARRTHLFCFSLPSLLYPGGSTTREDMTARAAFVKKFWACQHVPRVLLRWGWVPG